MVIAIIKAQVHPNKWEAIKKAFKSEIGALKLFPIAEIFLIQSKADPTFWQILSIWYSLDDLKEAQNRGSLPGELIIRIGRCIACYIHLQCGCSCPEISGRSPGR
jgi:hypothetical protein